jgi:hypothetical protein
VNDREEFMGGGGDMCPVKLRFLLVGLSCEECEHCDALAFLGGKRRTGHTAVNFPHIVAFKY